jgi:creatinine amidohydrolase
MRIADMNWMQVEEFLKTDDRCVLPLGSTEQHAYLSLSVDSLLAERIAVEAAEPLQIPVFPVVPYGLSPYFAAYPGSVSLRVATYAAFVRDVLDSLAGHGFRRILIVNGHGGNQPAQALVFEWLAEHPDARIRFHNWWNAPRAWAAVQAIDPVASHASWLENFPWTRLPGLAMPDGQKPMVDLDRLRQSSPAETRALLGDGNYGGRYRRGDDEMLAIWQAGVEETRALLTAGWGAGC